MNRTLSLVLIALLIGVASILVVCMLLIEATPELSLNYNLFDIDYIIPLPWYTQIQEISSLEFVDEIIPYYLYRPSNINSKRMLFNLYLIEMNGLNSLVGSTEYQLEMNSLVIDEGLSHELDIDKGEIVSMDFFGKSYSFVVSKIIEDFPFSTTPVAFISLTADLEALLLSNIPQLSYSGAFVRVNDFAQGDQYFYYKYRPLGKVGDTSWYNSIDSYEYMYQSISSFAAPSEIINVESLRTVNDTLKQDYQRAEARSLFLMCIFSVLTLLVLWLITIFARKKRDLEMERLGLSVSKIKQAYLISIVVSSAVSSIGSFIIYKNYGLKEALIFEGSIFLAMIIMILFIQIKLHKSVAINKSYKEIVSAPLDEHTDDSDMSSTLDLGVKEEDTVDMSSTLGLETDKNDDNTEENIKTEGPNVNE